MYQPRAVLERDNPGMLSICRMLLWYVKGTDCSVTCFKVPPGEWECFVLETLVRTCNWEFGNAGLHRCEQTPGPSARVHWFTRRIGSH